VEIDEDIDYAIPVHLNEFASEKDSSDEAGADDNDFQLNEDVAEGSVNTYILSEVTHISLYEKNNNAIWNYCDKIGIIYRI
jgi:hypothetical protein